MLDSEKIELIKEMIADFWECGNVTEDGVVSLLSAITVVINFKKG